MNYQETIEYLYKILPVFHRIGPAALKPGLENTIQLCKYFGNPQNTFKSIHIAGTNGKGSSSHMVASVLQQAGYRTGLYTSPHLKSYTERIKINGLEISEKYVVDFVVRAKEPMEKIKPSFFELTVAMAFDYFAAHQVDIAVIETGLGGRLDSTNIIEPVVSLITNISYDHQNILGNSLREIAGEKAGIIKAHTPVIISETQLEVKDIFDQTAKSMQAPIYFGDTIYQITNTLVTSEVQEFELLNLQSKIEFKINLDLTGQYQRNNLPGVLAVLGELNKLNFKISFNDIFDGLSKVVANTRLKGRWQRIKSQPLVICDTAHNEAGIKQIVEQISRIRYNKLYWIFGTVNDKDCTPILALLPKDAFYIFSKANIPRGLDAEVLLQKAIDNGLSGIVISKVQDAYEWAVTKATLADMIFIGGSNFIVAELDDL